MICFYYFDNKTLKVNDKKYDFQVLVTKEDIKIKERWFSVWRNDKKASLIHAIKSTLSQEFNHAFDRRNLTFTG